MRARVIVGVLVTLVVLAGLASLAVGAYRLGEAQAVVRAGELPAGTWPPAYVYGPRPFLPGLGLLGCLFPLAAFLLLAGLVRGLFFWGRPWGWRRHGRWGHGGPWGASGVPPMFEEWHRRAHQAEGGQTPGAAGPQAPESPA